MMLNNNNLMTALRTSLRKFLKNSDYIRWQHNESLHNSWDERTKIIAKLVRPSSTVIEFGAGNMAMKSHLDSSINYTPTDFVIRDDCFVKYDLNSVKLSPFDKKYDVAVFSGVLEYVNDIPRLIAHLSDNHIIDVIASYAINEKNEGTIFRRKSGWVNDYSAIEIKQIFINCGFKCRKTTTWKNQEIYLFTNDIT